MKKWVLGTVLAVAIIVLGFQGVSLTQSADPLPPEHTRG
jgi:hypothetical protein